ncbi:MAG: hypothetical protein ABR498_08775 [Candidatus Dormibacteria bacterium]
MVSEPLLSLAGVVAAVVAILVDGRAAVGITLVVIAAGLAPTVAVSSGGPVLLVLAGAALAGLIGGWLSTHAARRLPRVPGLDPRIPAYAPTHGLFGRRSVRAFTAAIAVPIASWVSFNVPIGEVTAVQGLLFPVAYIWACGLLRMVVARTIADLVIGVVMVALAGVAAWALRGGPDTMAGAVASASLAPLAAVVAGWLGGRHARRPAQEAAAT